MKKTIKISAPTPNPADGKAITRVIEKLSPVEKKKAELSRDGANQNPAR